MKSPPLQTHHVKLQDHISQTPPNSPLPSANPNPSLILFNKHQLNNYNNFFEFFDKLNPNGSLGVPNGGGGRKRELTPNQSADESQLHLNNFLNPSYQEGSHFRTSNHSGLMDQQKRQKLIKFSNSALDAASNGGLQSTPASSKSTQQKQQLQSASHFTSEIEKELSNLTLSIEKEMEKQQYQSEYFGNCAKCSKPVVGRNEACQAMNQTYHGSCFVCVDCGRSLRAKPFYYLNNQVYCEEDYLYSGFLENAEKCASCGHIIADMILQAMGKSYHPGCFRCFTCNECLDGLPFTLDINNHVYCIKDYYKLYAPKCASCGLSITPNEGTNETIRIVAMEKDFHVECYVCESCGMQLGDEPESRCYPLGKSLLCQGCHVKQVEMNQVLTFTNVKAATKANDFIFSTSPAGPINGLVKKNIQTENL